MPYRNILLCAVLLLCACHQSSDLSPDGSHPNQNQSTPELPPGVRLVETFDGGGDETSIPYSKYELDNGLTVILHEDHSDPMVHVDVTYHVGSSREEPGRSGFAHFFEHMMFEGSANAAQGQHQKILSNAGGVLNGSTNNDRTNYYETIPINQLEIALWLEADRMGFLLEAVSADKFEIQRETVKNERGQRVDNVPYGRVNETLMKNLYPADHPYSWPIIGWIEDLDAAELDDLKRFFLRWYGPNNAQLVIGGDIDPGQTLEWVEKYFGSLPRGPEVETSPKAPGELTEDRFITLEDNVHLPAIAMLFPTVYLHHPDEAPLDAAAKVIGQGRTSLLYQRLVQTGRAVQVVARHGCREIACEMSFIIIQNPSSGESLAEMELAIRETLREFSEQGLNQDDLDKFKAQIEAGQVFGMQSVGGKVNALAYSELMAGDPKFAQKDIERYAAVRTEDVSRAFNEHIANAPAVVLSVVPIGQAAMAARPPNFTSPERKPVSGSLVEAPPELRPVIDDFNRGTKPEPGFNPAVDLPPIWDTRLANDVRLLAVPNTETPTVTIQVIFEAGQRDEPPGKAGLASLTANLMTETTNIRSAAEFTEELERIGATISVHPGAYNTTVSLNTLSKHLDAAIALMMERILEPAFLAEDFDRVKSRRMESLIQSKKNGGALANRAINSVLAGPTHPLSYPGAGLVSTLEAVTLDDVKAFYAAHFPTHMSGVLVSTSLPQDEIIKALEPLAILEVSESFREPLDELQPVSGRTIYLVEKKDAVQSSLRIGHPSIPFDALGDYYRAGLMNFNLGGTFNSRINLNLREDKAYTYGAGSGFYAGPEMGSFRVSTEVEKQATTAAITEILGELELYSAEGMTVDEFEYMQNAIGQRDALRYETPGSKLGLLSAIITYDLPLDYRKKQGTLLLESERDRLNTLANTLIDPDNLAIVVVGDSATLKPELDTLGITVKMLDSDGFPIDGQ
jgi:zinc protease